MYSSLCNPSLIGRINLVVECQDEILSKGVGCDDLTFHLRIMDANDLLNPVKRVDFGQIWVTLDHHLETLADNH
jgi:hypothetical protein